MLVSKSLTIIPFIVGPKKSEPSSQEIGSDEVIDHKKSVDGETLMLKLQPFSDEDSFYDERMVHDLFSCLMFNYYIYSKQERKKGFW